MLMPAIRAIFVLYYSCDQPWRCLCRGSVQITRTTPLRRMILQLRQIFLTEAETLMSFSKKLLTLFHRRVLFRAEHNPCPRQVVGRQLHGDLVTRKDPDVVHPHLS